MSRKVKMRKQGKFYCSYEDDAYIIHGLLNYEIRNGRTGFPVTSLGKVEATLDNIKLSYVVIEDSVEVDTKDYNNNNYDLYLARGKEISNLHKKEKELMDKISKLPKDKLDKIIEYIENIIDE